MNQKNTKTEKQSEKVKTVSKKEFTDKAIELCEAIKNLDVNESKSFAAVFACTQIVNQAADNYCEGLVIFTEVMLIWRELSLSAMEDESEGIDNK